MNNWIRGEPPSHERVGNKYLILIWLVSVAIFAPGNMFRTATPIATGALNVRAVVKTEMTSLSVFCGSWAFFMVYKSSNF